MYFYSKRRSKKKFPNPIDPNAVNDHDEPNVSEKVERLIYVEFFNISGNCDSAKGEQEQ